MYRAGDEHAGIVDENVQPPKILHDGLDQSVDLLGISLIGLESMRTDALGVQPLDHVLGFFGRCAVADGDVGPVIGQGLGNGRADAP